MKDLREIDIIIEEKVKTVIEAIKTIWAYFNIKISHMGSSGERSSKSRNR